MCQEFIFRLRKHEIEHNAIRTKVDAITTELDESVKNISAQLTSYEELYKRKWGEELTDEYNFAAFYEKK